MKMARDPVCGMDVAEATAKHRADRRGKTYFFCSARCRERFSEEPDRFLEEAPAAADAAPPGRTYTCPMHPEVRQQGPGTCPLCGMALVKKPAAEEDR
jgi:Cu+-exporting ATPase